MASHWKAVWQSLLSRSVLCIAHPKVKLLIASLLYHAYVVYVNKILVYLSGYKEQKIKTMFYFKAATNCTQRLLALHPLNPHYWIEFAEFYHKMTAVPTRTGAPPSNTASYSQEAPPSSLSLYNPDYPCRTCMERNCTVCCIYRHNSIANRVQIEKCRDGCADQDLAPEVHFESSGCTLFAANPDQRTTINSVYIGRSRHGLHFIVTNTLQDAYSTSQWLL